MLPIMRYCLMRQASEKATTVPEVERGFSRRSTDRKTPGKSPPFHDIGVGISRISQEAAGSKLATFRLDDGKIYPPRRGTTGSPGPTWPRRIPRGFAVCRCSWLLLFNGACRRSDVECVSASGAWTKSGGPPICRFLCRRRFTFSASIRQRFSTSWAWRMVDRARPTRILACLLILPVLLSVE
jgi:hypothetical protein